ncbi:2-hydroxychromene-2-carboxylate isomerase [Roseovarius dicentrarchi]|uniref:2-hydroxychromene-2-carboxylate isomerase n=1 Tax=Roseovarius dicentrarchi TaxID=2250573 RepID=UPI000DEB34F7|nr:2-hydroxychromene-2-carboxylate isomerase [Roseovarius dicentrarchi]
MAQIDYFFSILSPYAYLAGNRLEEVARAHDAQITYKPIDFMAVMAHLGGPGGLHPARLSYMSQDIVRLADRHGMPLTARPAHWPANPAPASYAIIAAQAAGGGDTGALVHAFMRACWAEDRDVSDDGVVRDCLRAAGFDPGLADRGLLSGAETYGANNDEAMQRGVIGVPFYLTGDGAAFWGQDRLEDLDRHLAAGA